jgi:hypothetical protein
MVSVHFSLSRVFCDDWDGLSTGTATAMGLKEMILERAPVGNTWSAEVMTSVLAPLRLERGEEYVCDFTRA